MKSEARYALLPLVTLMLLPAAAAQERSLAQTEYDVLASIAGTYTYQVTEADQPASGRITFELLPGGRFLRFSEQWTPLGEPTMAVAGFIGYDVEHEYFTWYRVFENGAYDRAHGTRQDNVLTFDILEAHTEAFGEDRWAGPGIRLRTKWTIAPERGITRFVWERSVDGGDWAILSVAENTRVAPPVSAQSMTPEEQEVWQAVTACFAAVENEDQATLIDCFHEDYTFWWSEDIMPFGKDLVRRVVPVNLPAENVLIDDVRPAKILVKGNVAIVHYGLRRFARTDTGAEVTLVERVSMTLIKEDGRWQYLGGGGSPFVK